MTFKMEDRRFLLTFLNKDSLCSFNWYETEEEMREDIEEHPEWSDFEATEILQCKEIEI